MRKILFTALFFPAMIVVNAQNITQQLQKAYQQFADDSQLKHAISSFYVIDAATGQVVFDKNSQIGLAPASTQKIITAATAFELLTPDYGYKTWFYMNGGMKKDTLKGDLIIKGTGDPSFGSSRYESSTRKETLETILDIFKLQHIKYISGDIIIDESGFETNSVPTGWIWQDIGNYYGAGAYALNWNENQYDMILTGGAKEGDPVTLEKTDPELEIHSFINELKSGAKGSGDNGYIFLTPYNDKGFVRGSIPAGAQNFSISGSLPYPAYQFNHELQQALSAGGIEVGGKFRTSLEFQISKEPLHYTDKPFNFIISSALAKMVDWFLKKSINLYGEAFIKTIAYEKNGFGSTDKGIDILKNFWKQKGIDPEELNIIDGSGLSPEDRVTTHAQVEILKYARKQSWYTYFYNALPEYNNMKMKSGTIKDVKAFCGYQKAANGKEYIFSFLVNNYSGGSSLLVNKMYKVLDLLK
ncbi:MAG: D-alanyl-D-alanine carboxypeptidase/D-alanyl-D-alanine-endopeptidase [Chitinophagaceae bacterium]